MPENPDATTSSEPIDDSNPASVPAGWYPTPQGNQRFWDGTAWTDLPQPPSQAEPSSIPPHTGTRGRRTALIVGASVVALILLVGGIAGAVHLATPSTFTATGTLELTDPGSTGLCDGADGYTDIRGGAQVKITSSSGRVLAIGQLSDGEGGSDSCDFKFTVHDVPLGKRYYGVEITHRGIVQFSAKEIQGGDASLTLGD